MASGRRLRLVQPSSSGPDRTFFIHDQEIEEASVGEAERQFRPPSVEVHDVQIVDGHDPPFDLEVGRDGFLFGVGEVLVHSEVVMDSPDVHQALGYVPVVGQLFNESLHLGPIMPVGAPPPKSDWVQPYNG